MEEMKKTKIVCTMGPNANDEGLMRNLVKNGMNIARFNFSHGDYEEHKYRMDMLKKIREEEKIPVAILWIQRDRRSAPESFPHVRV